MAILNSSGDGSTSIKLVNSDTWRITARNQNVLEVTPNKVAINKDLDAVGGMIVALDFYQNKLLQGQIPQMSGAVVPVSASEETFKVYTQKVLPRSGSIIGLTMHSEDGEIAAGALSCSLTLDGANVATQLIMTTGSRGTLLFDKDSNTFSGSQAIGVSLTASADYENSVAASASWQATVLVEL